MRTVARRRISPKKPTTSARTVTVDLALIERFEDLLLSMLDDDRFNGSHQYNDVYFQRLLGRCTRSIHARELGEAVAEALAHPQPPTQDPAGIGALAELIKRKAAAAPAGTDLGHARHELLAVAASFFGGPDVGNPERHAALRDAGLLANDNATDAKAVA